MTDFHTDFKKLAKSESLTSSERARMRARLDLAMRETYSASMAYMPSTPPSVPSPHAPFFSFGFLSSRLYSSARLAYAFAAIVLIIGISGGTAFAAEGSVPGDALYGIKVNVNEPVALALATSPQAKADTHAAIAAERLSEATTLASEGALTASTSDALAASFATNASAATTIADSIATTDPAVASAVLANLSASVQTQASSLLAEGDQGSDAVRVASGDLVRSAIASTIGDAEDASDAQEADVAATASTSPELAIRDTSNEAPASAAIPAEAPAEAMPVAVAVSDSAIAETEGATSADVAVDESAPEAAPPSVSAFSAPLMKSASPMAPAMPASAPAATAKIRIASFAAVSAAAASRPMLSDLTDAIAEAQAQFDDASSTLAASSSASVAAALSRARLMELNVQADTSTNDDAAARRDLVRGLASVARLRALITSQRAND